MADVRLFRGAALDVLASLPDNSVDSVVTDPPYGLGREPDIAEVLRHWLAGDDYEASGSGFMGRSWDSFVPGPATWREVFRVLKPGGHALVFAGSRTVDLMGISMRLAGFEIRDQMQWTYGSGFPKSLDISKAIDKAAGAKREVVGSKLDRPGYHLSGHDGGEAFGHGISSSTPETRLAASQITAPATPEAEAWEGWGTALKPGHEPIIVARKPLIGTVVTNVLTYGTGGINIDASRIPTGGDPLVRPEARADDNVVYGKGLGVGSQVEPPGRFPANVILSHHPECEPSGSVTLTGDQRDGDALGGSRPAGFAAVGAEGGDGKPCGPVYGGETVEVWECHPDCPVAIMDGQSGNRRAGSPVRGDEPSRTGANGIYGTFGRVAAEGRGDSGGASRFFYCAKASRSERSAGVQRPDGNKHPTVKPVALMAYLVRLVTPEGGVMLDSFFGSGSTLVGAVMGGFDAIGVDRDDEGWYLDVAADRIRHHGGVVEVATL